MLTEIEYLFPPLYLYDIINLYSGQNKMPRYGIVFVTTGREKEAKKIARILVKEKLAACVNIVQPIQSYYIWKGKFIKDKETLLIIKTKSVLFDKLKKRVVSLHSYKVPEIIFVPIQKGLKSYLDWIKSL